MSAWFADFSRETLTLDGEADLFALYGIEGDDAFEFMDAFVNRFDVEVDGYRWYFHHAEEGMNIGGWFFKPPYRRVQRMPITPDLMVEAIDGKHWPVQYPPHDLPTVRWDIRVNQMMFVVPVVLFSLWLWNRFVA
ncbi:MAG: hypothetical protein B7Z42_12010 [Brevundimonas sp. 12-68-7]|uniref:DUF1493 domain-containing protein n=1 Tax=Brevundimonas subvibrioides TaxID=74313 RepID=A0A258FQM7_9CAUL|nr:MAG: hypothetical protein B7Z42_12010 [Brevundimonas sp. 12-68-7]OYX34811.1 MAG: hypothetical protein B7Z01_04540 [Brevundimonas subvibrioides]